MATSRLPRETWITLNVNDGYCNVGNSGLNKVNRNDFEVRERCERYPFRESKRCIFSVPQGTRLKLMENALEMLRRLLLKLLCVEYLLAESRHCTRDLQAASVFPQNAD